jgi:hypothetical protein
MVLLFPEYLRGMIVSLILYDAVWKVCRPPYAQYACSQFDTYHDISKDT